MNRPLGDYQVLYSAVATYPRPETDKEKSLREARGLPVPMFSFIVERIQELPDGQTADRK